MLRVTDVTVKRSDNGIITISVTYFADADNCATRRAKLSPRGFADALPQIAFNGCTRVLRANPALRADACN